MAPDGQVDAITDHVGIIVCCLEPQCHPRVVGQEPWQNAAKRELRDAGFKFEEIELGNRGLSYSTLAAVTGAGTTPQVYIEGQRIGGADELTDWLKATA